MGIPERKEREFQRREREILESALNLFNADNWQAVTIDQIARQTEIGKGTIYKHFASKDEIYARLALEFYAEMLTRLRGVDTDQPVLQQLRQWIAIAWHCHRRGREYHRLVSYCHRDDFRRGLAPTTRDAFDRLEHAFYQPLTRLLETGIERGEIPASPVPRLVNILRASFDGGAMLLWHPALHGDDPDRFIDDYTEFMLAGLTHYQAGCGAHDMPRRG